MENNPILSDEEKIEVKTTRRKNIFKSALMGGLGTLIASGVGIVIFFANFGRVDPAYGFGLIGVYMAMVIIPILFVPIGFLIVGPITGVISYLTFNNQKSAFLTGVVFHLILVLLFCWIWFTSL